MQLWTTVGLIAMLAASPGRAIAQSGLPGTWQTSVHFTAGVAIKSMNWDSTHGYMSGAGRLTETVYGTGNRPVELAGGFELRKNHIAIQGNVGAASVRVQLDGPEQSYSGRPYHPGRYWEYRAWQIEGVFLYFPRAASTSRVAPCFSAGLGFLTTSGDASVRGGSISYGGVVRISVSKRLAIDGGVRAQYQRYDGFPLLPPVVTPTLTFTPVALTIGARLKL